MQNHDLQTGRRCGKGQSVAHQEKGMDKSHLLENTTGPKSNTAWSKSSHTTEFMERKGAYI